MASGEIAVSLVVPYSVHSGSGKLIVVICVTFFLNLLHVAILLWLGPPAVRQTTDRVRCVIEALTLTGKHVVFIVTLQTARLRRQLNTLGVRVNANGIIG